jgi:hypothetical protein
MNAPNVCNNRISMTKTQVNLKKLNFQNVTAALEILDHSLSLSRKFHASNRSEVII